MSQSQSAKPSQIKKQAAATSVGKDSTSKSKLLLALKEEVVRLRTELHEEREEREKISSWLSQTLKPRLQEQFGELRETTETHEQQLGAIRSFLRENRGSGGADSVSRKDFEELEKQLAIEREARQQLSLWIKSQFGKNLEILDSRIAAQVSSGKTSVTNLPPGGAVIKPTVSVLPDSVPEWLRMIGYERYIDEFQRFKCTELDKVTRLTDDHLVKMGIGLKRHRGDLLHEVSLLRNKLENKEPELSNSVFPATPKRASVHVDSSFSVDPFSESDIEDKIEVEYKERDRKRREEKAWEDQERERIRKEIEAEERARLESDRKKAEREEQARLKAERARALQEEKEQRDRELEEEQRRAEKARAKAEKDRQREKERERIRKELEAEEREKEAERARLDADRKKAERARLDQEREEQARLKAERDEQARKKNLDKERKELERQQKALEKERAELEKQRKTLETTSKRNFPPPEEIKSDSESSEDLFAPPPKTETKPSRTTTKAPVPAKKPVKAEFSTSSESDEEPRVVEQKPASSRSTPNREASSSGDGKSNEDYISDVRSDSNPTNWVIFFYDKQSNSVKYGGSGAKGHAELISQFEEDKVQYALLRVVDTNSRIKFVYIQWIGPSTNFMTKSRSGTCKAGVLKMIGQFHIEIIAESVDDISKKAILSKLQAAVNF